MDNDRSEVERHMAAFRAHGEMNPSVFTAQFLALLVVMCADQLATRETPTDSRADVMTFMQSAIEQLDRVSPGYAALMRRLLPSPRPVRR